MPDIIERVEEIRKRLEYAAAERWGRIPQIIAVSKTIPSEIINEITSAGIFRIGENRVQEILEKFPYLDASFQIDMIGRLQSNKVKYIIDKVNMIQSVDRESLAVEIDRRAQQHNLVMPVLIQVNIGNEPQKGGVDIGDTISFARHVASLPGISLRGLMAVMPDIDDQEVLRPYFRKMRCLYEQLQQEAIDHTQIETLSMGMSGDYELAAQEGATVVRIGSAIFGTRTYANQKSLKGDN